MSVVRHTATLATVAVALGSWFAAGPSPQAFAGIGCNPYALKLTGRCGGPIAPVLDAVHVTKRTKGATTLTAPCRNPYADFGFDVSCGGH